ncbi:extracellular solute-binding protein [Paludicola sp. MB14-C6]|uniref:extracellular solute-binding protein n=1 Tax=Paludihabitans sp. MB14-C6 TaxID=3070656 RepID=UPI0027DE0AFA|nr:extracellular solute-binding protein [Paludicola sp. MB14-C6]WMJ22632.1 extracellular solute-binding protein [Paludicola sp. MB14-C6]
MKKILSILLILTCILSFTACSGNKNNKVVIYSSAEDFRNEYILKRLKEQFPKYDIALQYQSTGNNAAKLKSEGKSTECDIVLGLESGYMELLSDNFAKLDSYDNAKYINEMKISSDKYAIWERYSGTIVINKKVLQEKGLPVPKSYNDLLDPKYKDLIAMPNPKASGTGYIFLKSIVNAMGEEKAFQYFDSLSKNVLQFTSSGSGPVKLLVSGEIGIGLGLTLQAVKEINDGVNLELIQFSEGLPYTTTGFGIIEGKQNKQATKDVFNYLYSTLINEDKDKYSPEQIFEGQTIKVENYPKEIKYSNMDGIRDLKEKDRLLAKWKY